MDYNGTQNIIELTCLSLFIYDYTDNIVRSQCFFCFFAALDTSSLQLCIPYIDFSAGMPDLINQEMLFPREM